jgi:hypothetical protein
MASYYQTAIRETLATIGRIGTADPRHVEAWMRCEHPTLDGLSRSQFTAEVETALQCIDAGPLNDSERLAQSFGL